MSRTVILTTPSGERTIEESALPLQVGSFSSADIRVPGAAATTGIATIGLLEDRLLLQVASATGDLLLNDAPASGTRWLSAGDVLEYSGVKINVSESGDSFGLVVDYTAVEYQTLPPDEEPQATGDTQDISPVRRRAVQDEDSLPVNKKSMFMSLTGAFLLLLAIFAFYIFTARSVAVIVQPETAAIDIDGGMLRLSFDEHFLLRPGDYDVSITAGGYYPLQEQFTVTAADNQAFEYALEKKPGRILISLPDGIDATFRTGERLLAATSGEEFELKPGKHVLRIESARYLDYILEIDVEGAGVLQEFSPELIPGWAEVTLNTNPTGAEVFVGGERISETPVVAEIMAGTVVLELRKPGYKTWSQSLIVEANQPQELPLIELLEQEGVVKVSSTPAGATITVDGQYQGAAPIEIELDKGASYRIEARLTGYAAAKQTVRISKAGEQRLSFALEPLYGELVVNAQPGDAELIVDGKSFGPANQTVRLTALPHQIEVRKPGYESYFAKLTPQPGLSKRVDVRLLTPAEAVLAANPVSIKTSQGAELRLVKPGKFSMGSGRREQGRRANEIPREVELTRPFYIGLREVSNKEYREFNPSHTSGADRYRELAADSHPAVQMSWDEAARFCNWLSDKEGLRRAYVTGGSGLVLADPPTNGYRLPTEAEWTWVARYAGGGQTSKYPWGDRMPPPDDAGNFADISADGFVNNILRSYEDGYPVTAPVGKFNPNPIGIFDLGGNVAEWVNDYYAITPSAAGSVEVDPAGPASGRYHVIRGSGWRHAGISELRYAYRDFGEQGRLDVGLRLARYTDAVMD